MPAQPKATLEELLRRLGFAATVEEHMMEEGLLLDVKADDAGRLIGRQGQTLSELQYILNRLLFHHDDSAPKVTVDVGGYRAQAREAIARFAAEYGAKYPKAVTTLEQDADALLTFFDFPAEHWKHLRTSNVIESPFATVRLRQRVTKGAGSRTKGLLMAYKLLDMAQARWRRIDGAHLLPLVQDGVAFVDGVEQVSKRGKPRARAA